MPADLRSLMQLEVPVIVQVAERSMSLDQVMALAPGSIVQLNKSADEELDILVGAKPIGKGRAVKVGENFGVRMTRVGDVRRQLDGLAAADSPAESAASAAPLRVESAEPAPTAADDA